MLLGSIINLDFKSFKKILLISILFFYLGFNTLGQPLQIIWQRCYGGSDDDFGLSVLPSPSGYYLFGMTDSNDGDVNGNHGGTDFWLLAIDSSGNFIKSNCFGGTGYDLAKSMNNCPDGGYILSGAPWSTNGDVKNNHGGCDYWLIKTDDEAVVQWQKCFGGSCNDEIHSLQVTSDSGFLCSGVSCSVDGDVTGNHGLNDFWVIKVDKNGNLKWEKSLGGSKQDWGMCASETTDGGEVVGGWSESTDGDVNCQHHGGINNEIDAWMVKLDSSRNIEWQKCYGGSDIDVINQILPMDDGSYLFMGITYSYDGDITNQHGAGDFWVGKTDHWGNLLWNHCYGGTEYDNPSFIKRLSDGKFIIGGLTISNNGDVSGNHSFNGYTDMWIIKITSDGDLIWEQCFGGTMNESLDNAIEIPSNRLLLIGSSFTSDNTGDVQCDHHGPGTYDNWLLMVYDSTTVGIKENSNLSFRITASPNPATDYVKFSYKSQESLFGIEIKVANQLGQIVKEVTLPSAINELTWDTSKIPSGIYYYYYRLGNTNGTGKIAIMKL
ncbi:MAG: T9SS type A sorting domain-containing protein [Bacteroidota bacterium]